MTTDNSNFRSIYYGNLGFNIVEETKQLNKLLQENIRDLSKLKQFCLTYAVPTAQRGHLWNIILGILPLHKNSTDYILEQRTAVYEDLHRAVTVMQYIDGKTSAKSRVLFTMWLLENNRLLHTGSGSQEDDNNFIEIVNVLLKIFDDDVQTYWIAKEFYSLIKCIQNESPKLKDFAQAQLKREDIALHNHLENLGVFSSNDILEKLYATGFAGVFNESALVKIWDRICGGSKKIVIFVFLELVKTYRKSIMNCDTQKKLKLLIEQVKDQDAAIVNKAINAYNEP